MEKERITALAREYAEEKGKKMEREQSLPNCLIKEVMGMDAEELINFLQWLLRRYALVEKSKVKQLKQCFGSEEVYEVIDMLFPEIKKEVEG